MNAPTRPEALAVAFELDGRRCEARAGEIIDPLQPQFTVVPRPEDDPPARINRLRLRNDQTVRFQFFNKGDVCRRE